MKAAWYERQGDAADVLRVGTMPDPEAGAGEVRVRLAWSGINPGDTKKRMGWLGFGMAYPRVIPHSDGAGTIDAVGEGVSAARIGQRVWVSGAQSYRPFGTAAELVVVPEDRAVSLPDGVGLATGACLGISARTAHRCVFADGPVAGRTLLVHGGAGNVGHAAVALAAAGGARVIATAGASAREMVVAAGAEAVLDRHAPDLADRIREIAGPAGVDRIVEVAFGANIRLDEQVMANGGTIVAYASNGDDDPAIPFWPLLFRNAVIRLVGSDDLPADAERAAIEAITDCLASGRLQPVVAARFPLEEIAAAHELVDRGSGGHVLIRLPFADEIDREAA